MAEIEWDASLSVGNEGIDLDHQKLFEIFSRLNSAMIRGAGKNLIEEITDELINYTEYHFKREEELFSATDYPAIDQHKKAHADFIRRVNDFKGELLDGKGKGFVSIKVQNTLVEWLKGHIGEVDKGYSAYLK